MTVNAVTLPIDDPEGLHPRPQLRRPWVDLSGPWGFATDDADVGIVSGWSRDPAPYDRTIVVPYPPESPASGIGDRGRHPVVWYRRTARIERPEDGRRVVLHFGAVDYRAQVWVNGRAVAGHEGGHTPFSADITSALAPDGEQVVVVRAEDPVDDLTQPRGKQDWEDEPHAIWYHRTTGIWQPVWYEVVPATRVVSVHHSADIAESCLHLSIAVRRADDRPLRLRVRVRQRGELRHEEESALLGETARRAVPVRPLHTGIARHVLMWAPEHPNLLDLTVELLDESGDVVDRVESYLAMRTAAATEGRFELNGQPYLLRLVLAQGYWPQSHLAAPDAAALRREVELVKALGFNGVRLHQKVEDPRFLAWCDRLGLLVWAEMPSAYEPSPVTTARTVREWLEVLERDRSHPCVIVWVPTNESWGVPSLRSSRQQQAHVAALYHLSHAIDGTRPVVGNDGWEQVVTDILTVHDYSGRGAVLRDRYGDADRVERTLRSVQPGYRSLVLPGGRRGGEPVMVTEFGGLTLTDAGETWNGYGAVEDAEAFLRTYEDLLTALLDSPALVGFCWTQLTDTVQERNGLLTERREPKVPIERIRAITTRLSAAVPGDAIGAFDFGDYPVPLGDGTRDPS